MEPTNQTGEPKTLQQQAEDLFKSQDPKPADPNPPVEDELKPNSPYEAKPRKSEDWKNLQSLKEEALERASTAEAKVAQLEAQLKAAVPTDDIQAALKEREQLSELLKQVALERSPEFQTKYDRKLEPIRNQLKLIAGDKADVLINTVTPTGYDVATVKGILEDMSPTEQQLIVTNITSLASVLGERQAEIDASSSSYDQLIKEQTQQQEQHYKDTIAQMEQAFNQHKAVWQDQEQGIPALIPEDGNEDHNKKVDERLSRAQAVFSGNMSPEDLAQSSLWIALGPDIAHDLKEANEEITKLKDQIKKLGGPSTSSTPSTETDEDKYKDMDFAQRITQQAMDEGLLTR